MPEYFLEPKSSGRIVKVELDLSNHAIKADSKKIQQMLVYENLLKMLS